jgi:hypothetical protein
MGAINAAPNQLSAPLRCRMAFRQYTLRPMTSGTYRKMDRIEGMRCKLGFCQKT